MCYCVRRCEQQKIIFWNPPSFPTVCGTFLMYARVHVCPHTCLRKSVKKNRYHPMFYHTQGCDGNNTFELRQLSPHLLWSRPAVFHRLMPFLQRPERFFFQQLGSCRHQTPRKRVDLQVHNDTWDLDLSNATLRLDLTPRRSPSACPENDVERKCRGRCQLRSTGPWRSSNGPSR